MPSKKPGIVLPISFIPVGRRLQQSLKFLIRIDYHAQLNLAACMGYSNQPSALFLVLGVCHYMALWLCENVVS